VGWHSASGLFWVKETLQQRGAVGRWLMIVSDYLFAWEWPNGWPEPRLVTIILMTITALTLVAIAGGAFFWIARPTKAAPASATRENTAFFVFWIFAPLVVAHELSVEAP